MQPPFDPNDILMRRDTFQACTLPIIRIQLNGTPATALIDSGASVNILSADLTGLIPNCKAVSNPNVSLKTITGIEIATNKAVEVNVKIQNSHFLTSFIISNGPLSSTFDLILGMTFLEENRFTIDCENHLVKNESVCLNWLSHSTERTPYTFSSELENPCPEHLEINNVNANFGILNNKVKILPHAQQIVKLRIQNYQTTEPGQILLVEPNTKLNDSPYFVAHAITSVSDTQTCLAQILNTSNETIILNKNTKLVSLSPLEYSNCISDSNVNCVQESQDNFFEKFNLLHLSSSEKPKVMALLNKYRDIFATDVTELGNCSIIQHKIHLSDNIPTRQKPYRVPYNLKSEMKKQLEDLLDAGIIQPSTSPYAAPVLLVRKSDGSYRLVADLRKLNEKTLPDNFPIPNLNEMIDMLTGAKYFSSLDLTSGFHQMSMHPDDAHLTGIATDLGHFEYCRMPFGLKNASSSFQRLMSIVLTGLSDLQIAVYIDDVIIASTTFNEHLERLELVFDRLKQANLKLKPKKCSLLRDEITYLGHRVTEGRVMPDPKNIDSIKHALPPKTKKQIRAFLGLTGFYRKFIPQYSKLALPLTNLTRDEVNFQWTKLENDAFEALKNFLVTEPCLRLPNFDKPFAICTDASKYSLGAVLVQEDETGFQHPISFASRKLNKPEINYSVFEKEALGVVFGIEHFKQYLYGREFIVYCDQKSLSQIFKLKDPTSRIARWIITLQQYSYKIIHKPGRLNLMADYLSRADITQNHTSDQTIPKQVNAVNCDIQMFNLNSLSDEDIISEQKVDNSCKTIVKKLKQNFQFSPNSPHFFLQNGMLVCTTKNSSRFNNVKLVVPQTLIQHVLEMCHDNNTVAHAGLSRTLHRVKQNFFWHGLYKNVKNFVASCHSCIQRRGFNKPTIAPLQKIPTPSRPFEKCSIDAVGPLITSKHGNKWLLVITDYFTRYPEAYPVPNIQSSTVARVLIDFISRHGLMKVLYSDKGANFLAEAMNEVYDIVGISKQHTVSYNPQGNGVVERLNKTLIDTLSHLVSETQEDWCEHVPLALMAFRTAFHRTIQETPAFLVYGRDILMPYDLIFTSKLRTYNDTPTYAQNLVSQLQTSFDVVKQNLEKSADNQVSQTNGRTLKNINVGDFVYLHTPKIKLHTSKKLSKQNDGPYRVTKKCSPVIFEISLIADPNKTQKVHINRLIKVVVRETFPSNSAPAENISQAVLVPQSVYVPPSEEELNKLYPPIFPQFDSASALRFFDDVPILFNQGLPNYENTLPEPSSPSHNDSFTSDFFRDTSVSPVSFLSQGDSQPWSAPSSPNSIQPNSQLNQRYNLRPRDSNGFVKNN